MTQPLRRYSGAGEAGRTWYLVSRHGAVLFYLATHPDRSTSEVAQAMRSSAASVRGILKDLLEAGMLKLRSAGGAKRYSVNPGGKACLPGIPSVTLDTLLGGLEAGAGPYLGDG